MSDIPPRLTPSDNDPRRISSTRYGQTGIWVVLVLLAILIIVALAYSSNMTRVPVADPDTAVETPAAPGDTAVPDAGNSGATPDVEPETARPQNPPVTNP